MGLYDVTSTYLEGNGCELGKYGYNRDKKKGKTQIVFGLLCDQNGCPIAVEVFEGNTSDTSTLGSQIEKVRKRFGVHNVVWVTDRGILTSSNIKELVKPVEGLDYISGLTKASIRKLAEVEAIKLGLFELIIKATKREKRALKGADKIALRVGKVLNKYKINKYYNLDITDSGFSYERKQELISEEIALDGVYILRTSVDKTLMDGFEVVKAYKSLSSVEEAFRCYKSIDLKVRPIYHYKGDRVKAHIFLCMLAYYV